MQDPDQTIPVPFGYGTQGQPQGPAHPYGQGQFPQQANGWPPAQQSPYPQQGQQPGAYNPGPGQFSAYQPGPQFSQSPQTPPPPKKRGLLWASIGVVVLLVLGLGGFFAFTHRPAANTSTQNTTAQSSTAHVATAQASANQSGKNASASSSAQSSASSNGNTVQGQATAVVSTALAQIPSQGNNSSAQTQAVAQAGPPAEVARSFFTAIQNQDYNTAYKYTSFKAFTSDSFHQASTASDQSLGKLTAYSIGKTTIFPGATSTNAQVIVTVTRTNVPSHSGLAMLTLENGTWKITDGTVWQ